MSNSFFIKNKELDYIYKIDNANNKEVINKKNDFKKIVNLINKKDINENIKEVNIKEVNIKEDKVKYKINYNKLLENFVNNNEKKNNIIGGDSSIEENNNEYDNEDYWNNECKEYNKIPHLMEKRDRIIAIGDIHGDWELTLKCLKLAKVLNKDCTNENNAKWIGGNTVVIQIGDQIDRCRPMAGQKCEDKYKETELLDDEHSDIRIMKFFTQLDSMALENKKDGKKDSGRVISLLGNHEILNSQKKMTYVSAKGLACYDNDCDEDFLLNANNKELKEMIKKGKKKRKKDFTPGNKMAIFMGCTRLSAIVIGKFLFIHAGILPKLAQKIKNKFPESRSLKDLNIIITKWLLGKIKNNEEIDGIGSIMDILTNYELSPFWPRVLGNLENDLKMENKSCQEDFKPTFEILNPNIKNMVIGHTPQFYANNMGLNSTCDNQIWRIDTGSSIAFNVLGDSSKEHRKIQILEILNDGEEVNIIKEITKS
jgi:hypothetical protein